jgi:hydroxymethylbilane synthase
MTKLTLGCAGTPRSVARSRLVRSALEAAGIGPVEVWLLAEAGTLGGNSGPAANGACATPIRHALAQGEVDAAVVGMEQVPAELDSGLMLAAVLPRTSVGDLLVMTGDRSASLDGLPRGSVLGVASPRTRALALAFRPDCDVRDWEDGLDERLRRVDEGHAEATVVSGADLRLLGLSARAAHALDETAWIPSPGQGAVGVVTRAADQQTLDVITALDDGDTRAAVAFERSVVAALGAEASSLVGAIGLPYGGGIRGWAMVASPDGRHMVRADLTGDLSEPEGLGERVAQRLNEQGAREILEQSLEAAAHADASS